MAPMGKADGQAKSAKKRERQGTPQDLGTAELEALVFGKDTTVATRNRAVFDQQSKAKKQVEAEASKGAEGSEGDVPGGDADGEVPASCGVKRKEDVSAVAGQSAWADPDDEMLEVNLVARHTTKKLRRTDKEKTVSATEYQQRLREQFVKMNGKAQWAEEKPELSDEEDSEDEKEIPTSAAAVAKKSKGGPLQPNQLDIERRKDVPIYPGGEKGAAAISSLQFHPSSELIMSAGRDKTLRLHTVDGEDNAKVSATHFVNFQIRGAAFTPIGSEVICSGSNFDSLWNFDVATATATKVRVLSTQLHKNLFGLTMGPNPREHPGLRSSNFWSILGDSGSILVSDVATKHVVRTLRMAAPGVAAAFSPTRDTLFTADTANNIYEWDLGSGKCLQRSKDSWATGITSLAIRGTSAFSPTPLLAVGTRSGNVDFFELDGPRLPKEPWKTVDNLTTSINVVKFHPGGELLAAASAQKKDALKLVHSGTCSVYQNWPTMRTPIQRVSALDFSPRGGYLAMGNERGRVLLYQLGHYETNVA